MFNRFLKRTLNESGHVDARQVDLIRVAQRVGGRHGARAGARGGHAARGAGEETGGFDQLLRRLLRPPGGGDVELMADDFEQPNGLCFSLDESLLYINDSPRAHIRVFDVNAHGSLSNSRLFFENIGTGEIEGGIVDGMKLDERGNIYVTGPRGMWVITSEGEHLGIIEMPEHAGNLNWGGPNWDELYCCCATSVYRVKMKVSGNKLGYMD